MLSQKVSKIWMQIVKSYLQDISFDLESLVLFSTSFFPAVSPVLLRGLDWEPSPWERERHFLITLKQFVFPYFYGSAQRLTIVYFYIYPKQTIIAYCLYKVYQHTTRTKIWTWNITSFHSYRWTATGKPIY